MTEHSKWPAPRGRATVWSLAILLAISLVPVAVHAQSGFPTIPLWGYSGAWQPGPDSVVSRSRTLTIRWLRDPAVEARSDFGGYRIYRVTGTLDSTRMMLVRRFSMQPEDRLFLWRFPPIDAGTPLADRVATFIDPDSNGNYVKRCRVVDEFGRCVSRGDSIFVLIAPPGPHNGFRTWYSITYEELNKGNGDSSFGDMFVRDPSCTNPDTTQCPNLNHKLRNVVGPLEATPGTTENLNTVSVVPNPFRGAEAWDQPGGNEVQFINLPSDARIRIYTLAGDLVRDLRHSDPVRDFERWDLKNGKGEDVVSGIYVYRVESGVFTHQSRFVVIR